jgi:hypothetical protein
VRWCGSMADWCCREFSYRLDNSGNLITLLSMLEATKLHMGACASWLAIVDWNLTYHVITVGTSGLRIGGRRMMFLAASESFWYDAACFADTIWDDLQVFLVTGRTMAHVQPCRRLRPRSQPRRRLPARLCRLLSQRALAQHQVLLPQ